MDQCVLGVRIGLEVALEDLGVGLPRFGGCGEGGAGFEDGGESHGIGGGEAGEEEMAEEGKSEVGTAGGLVAAD